MLQPQALTPKVWRFNSPLRIFKEAHFRGDSAKSSDVSSCGGSKEKALRNLKEAVRLFMEEAERMGTLEQILEEAGYSKSKREIASPKFISVQRVTSNT